MRATILNSMRKYSKALQLYNECLKTQEKIRGVDHPNCLETKNNIALVLENMGQYPKAL